MALVLCNQITQRQACLATLGMQALSKLLWGVIQYPLLSIAAIMRLSAPAGEGAGMVAGLGQREGRWAVSSIELPGDAGLVDIAMQVFNQHLAADPGQEGRAPVGAGEPFGDGHPSRPLVGQVILTFGLWSCPGE